MPVTIRSTRSWSAASASAPRACRSASESTGTPADTAAGSPSISTMCVRSGSSAPVTLLACTASSAMRTFDPESLTMKVASSGSVVG
jgi:hypothetical protein